MCRCSPNIRTPYCKDCNSIFPKKALTKGRTSLVNILKDGFDHGNELESTLIVARENGYLVTQGEVEIAWMVMDNLTFDEDSYQDNQ